MTQRKSNEHWRGIFFMIFLMLFGFLFSEIFSVMFLLLDGFILQVKVKPNMSFFPWMVIFSQITTFLLPLAVWLAVFRENINQHLPHMSLGKTNIVLIITISILLNPVINLISLITSYFFPNQVSEIMQPALEGNPLFLMILAVAATPAICEEIVFRGYIQSTFKNKPLYVMLLVNGLFFAIMHKNAQQFFYTFILGIILAYMVYATRSIRAAIIAHFVMNASSLILMRTMLHIMEFYFYPVKSKAAESSDLTAIIFWGIFSIAPTFFAIQFFREFIKHNKKRFEKYDLQCVLKKEDPTSGGDEVGL